VEGHAKQNQDELPPTASHGGVDHSRGTQGLIKTQPESRRCPRGQATLEAGIKSGPSVQQHTREDGVRR